MDDALRVTAWLGSDLAGDPPHLDALLVYVASRLAGKGTVEGWKVDRSRPCPDTSAIEIPLRRREIAGLHVAMCTSPILDEVTSDRVEHIAKRIGVEHAGALAKDERTVVTTSNQWTKSYRLPLRVRSVRRVVWLCVGSKLRGRRNLLNALKQVPAIGKKISDGYGRVATWECESLGQPPHDRWPWWIESEAGPVLMRPLPAAQATPGLIGARPDFGACTDPYWHQDRYLEIIVPC